MTGNANARVVGKNERYDFARDLFERFIVGRDAKPLFKKIVLNKLGKLSDERRLVLVRSSNEDSFDVIWLTCRDIKKDILFPEVERPAPECSAYREKFVRTERFNEPLARSFV